MSRLRLTSSTGSERTKLRLLGFFPERDGRTATHTPLCELVREQPRLHEAEVVKYLNQGTTFIGSPGVVFDVLDGSGPIGSGSIRTDGVWAWPDDLAHYVEYHHAALPRSS